MIISIDYRLQEIKRRQLDLGKLMYQMDLIITSSTTQLIIWLLLFVFIKYIYLLKYSFLLMCLF